MSMSKMDANQVIKMVFSEADGALKTVPGAATSFSVELDADDGDSIEVRSKAVDAVVLINAVTAGADLNSSAVNTLNYRIVGVILNASTLAGTLNATATVQMSMDNTVWIDTSTTGTLDSANKVLDLSIKDFPGKYMRIRYAHGGVSGGTITAKYVLKG